MKKIKDYKYFSSKMGVYVYDSYILNKDDVKASEFDDNFYDRICKALENKYGCSTRPDNIIVNTFKNTYHVFIVAL